MHRSLPIFLGTLLLIASLAYAAPAHAQTGPGLLITPWPEQQQTEGRLRGQSFSSDVRGQDESLRMQSIEAVGRVRWDPHAEHSPAFGTDVFYMNLDSGVSLLPNRLLDASLAASVPITRAAGFEFGATVGGGFAGDLPFTDEHAWYAKSSLVAFRSFGQGRNLIIGIEYHGNRTIFPDLPLPGLLWVHDLHDNFQYTLGIPYSSLTYRLIDRLTLQVGYNIPVNFDAEVTFDIAPQFQLYTDFNSTTRAFHLNEDDRNRRLFYTQRRVEAGLRWQATPNGRITVGGGYAFDQTFERGFDVRSTDRLRRLSNEPYLRFALGFDF